MLSLPMDEARRFVDLFKNSEIKNQVKINHLKFN